jgi:hypothetical protein
MDSTQGDVVTWMQEWFQEQEALREFLEGTQWTPEQQQILRADRENRDGLGYDTTTGLLPYTRRFW